MRKNQPDEEMQLNPLIERNESNEDYFSLENLPDKLVRGEYVVDLKNEELKNEQRPESMSVSDIDVSNLYFNYLKAIHRSKIASGSTSHFKEPLLILTMFHGFRVSLGNFFIPRLNILLNCSTRNLEVNLKKMGRSFLNSKFKSN